MTHTLLECLLAGDPALARLTRKYLLDTQTPYVTQGWIGAFLERFDPQTGRWGRGIYGPKWISTLYTMRDLAACGREYLLRKGLMRRETDGSLILPQITRFHFPDRWHYDVLRALLYLANTCFPFDPRMTEAMDLLKDQFSRGYLLRGSAYSGLVHFPMETGRIGMMNTLRGLRVLRQYDPQLCARLLEQPLPAAVGPAIRK